MMRVDTDKYIVCDECSEAQHFGNCTNAQAEAMARRSGWKVRKGRPVCDACLVKRAEEMADAS